MLPQTQQSQLQNTQKYVLQNRSWCYRIRVPSPLPSNPILWQLFPLLDKTKLMCHPAISSLLDPTDLLTKWKRLDFSLPQWKAIQSQCADSCFPLIFLCNNWPWNSPDSVLQYFMPYLWLPRTNLKLTLPWDSIEPVYFRQESTTKKAFW